MEFAERSHWTAKFGAYSRFRSETSTRLRRRLLLVLLIIISNSLFIQPFHDTIMKSPPARRRCENHMVGESTIREIRPSGDGEETASQHLFMQEDDMASWL
ncbi:Uncharacterized protein Adt_34037 [Abeliophyllum distichum]|uniref:Uncharacterized protein n=1 Tax=Abeliophyllum distichum TaxID=126358 RepID=A0ABD1QXZ3_9LAMI